MCVLISFRYPFINREFETTPPHSRWPRHAPHRRFLAPLVLTNIDITDWLQHMALEPSIFLKDLITNHVLSHSGRRYGYCSAPRATSHGEFCRKYRRRYVRLDTTHYFTHVSPSSLFWIDLVAWLQIPYNCCDRTGWWLRLFINMIQLVTQVVIVPPS